MRDNGYRSVTSTLSKAQIIHKILLLLFLKNISSFNQYETKKTFNTFKPLLLSNDNIHQGVGSYVGELFLYYVCFLQLN